MKFGSLTIDQQVELPERRGPNITGRPSEYADYKDQLKALAIGDGFFIECDNTKDTNGLFNFAKSIGVFMARGFTEQDEVYGKKGVRFVRISQELADSRKRDRKPKADAADAGAAAPTATDSDL